METKQHKRLIFWIRLIGFILIGGLIPFIYLVIRFNLFSKLSTLNIGGWGIIAIIFIAVFIITMLKIVKKGMQFSFATKCINGIIKVIMPLGIFLVIIYFMKDYIDELFNFIVIVLCCEMIAIPLNPLPEWANQSKENKEEKKFVKFAKSFWKEKDL